MPTYSLHPKPSFSLPSILAFAAAVGSFFVGSLGGLLLAIAAIVLGAVGILLALAPSVRGGFVSLFSMLLGVVGIIAAVVRFIF